MRAEKEFFPDACKFALVLEGNIVQRVNMGIQVCK